MKRSSVSLVALSLAWSILAAAHADELNWNARTLLKRSVARHLQLAPDGKHLTLEQGELFEDDGPAAGYSYRPNDERLSDRVWIKKELLIPNPQARSATLLVAPGGELKGMINGKSVELGSPGKTGKYWQTYSIPPDLLKAGKNEIVLFGAAKVWIARAEDFAAGSMERATHPNRSARSADAGATWDYDRLGPAQTGGEIDGEYCVRLYLEHARASGSLESPVFDAGNLSGATIAPPLAKPVPIRARVETQSGAARLKIRSGETIHAGSKAWSEWQDLPAKGELVDPRGRFFQLRVELATSDPLVSPRLAGLTVAAIPPPADDWSAKLKVVESTNAEVIRSAIPFPYESFDHPKLKELRTRHKLDDLAKGARTELELIERLAQWSAGCWERGHLGESYPAWNALEILRPHADGKPIGGFCQQYNLVLLQACESFGIPGRAVSIGAGDHLAKIGGSGHEVIELWSNQFGKWIYVDGNFAWYAVDAKTRAPLSLWELRERQLRELQQQAIAASAEKTEIVHLLAGGKRWEGLASWPAFHEMRLIPRSNFLEAKSPLPLHQGMRGWFWTGHHVWTDNASPASLIYGHRVANANDWNWNLNQARFTILATSTPGELRVYLETETPGLEIFRARRDDTPAAPVASDFLWKLHSGRNELAVWSRNLAGREGGVSRIVIEQR